MTGVNLPIVTFTPSACLMQAWPSPFSISAEAAVLSHFGVWIHGKGIDSRADTESWFVLWRRFRGAEQIRGIGRHHGEASRPACLHPVCEGL